MDRKIKTSPRPWSLPNLLKANRNAATLHATLQWLANGQRQLHTTRAELGKVCGLGKDTITAAMAALDKGGWITLRLGSDGSRSWYQVTLKPTSALWNRKNRSHSDDTGRLKNRSHSKSLSDRKNPPHSGGGGNRKNQPHSGATMKPEKPVPTTVGSKGEPDTASPSLPVGEPVRSPEPEPFTSFEDELAKLQAPATHPDARVQCIVEAFDGRVVPEHERVRPPYIPNPGEPPEQIDGVDRAIATTG